MITCSLNRIYFPVTTLGWGRRLGVWFQGCQRRCEGCMSPQMQQQTGPFVPIKDVLAQIPGDIRPDGMTVSGGEPFDQPQALKALVEWFLAHHTRDVLVYTGYTLGELRARDDEATGWVLAHIAALADGPYVSALDRGVGAMGSDNQRLYIFSHEERYLHFACSPRRMQCVDERDQLFLIGLPPK